MIKPLRDEAGYSLVEVMASIVILTIAIIPMVSMFDMGLKTANTGSNYDKARAFANERLERAKVLPYAEVNGNNFPQAGVSPVACVPGNAGCRRYNVSSVPTSVGLPVGSSYRVQKQYVVVPNGPAAALQNSNTDSKMIRVTVTVTWPRGSINVSGIVAGGLA